MNRVRSLLSMRCMLLGYSFDPRLNSRTLGYDNQFVNKLMLTLEKFDERNKTDESRRSGCGDFKGLTRFSRASSFLLLDQEKDKRRLCSTGTPGEG